MKQQKTLIHELKICGWDPTNSPVFTVELRDTAVFAAYLAAICNPVMLSRKVNEEWWNEAPLSGKSLVWSHYKCMLFYLY